MPITLASIKGKTDKRKPSMAGSNKLQELQNKRMKRKKALMDAMNKIHDPDIA